MTIDVVVPSARPGRVAGLLARLDGFPGRIIVVDGRGRSPAAARNVGWRSSSAMWIAFLDDDVLPSETWCEDLHRDLAGLPANVAGSQGRIVVPLPTDRRPTDWERNVHGLECARWATADMAYRRQVLADLSGFDERFPRAYREDADLALRALQAGYELRRGSRRVVHPVPPAGPWVSIRRQTGNADDVLMRLKHGRGWRRAAGAGRGRLGRHVATTAAGVTGLAGVASRRPALAVAGLAGWAAGTVELASARIAPGPRSPREVATMIVTSVALPAVATGHLLAGWVHHWRLALRRPCTSAVLFDRDGTLIENVPYNTDPEHVRLMPGARAAVSRVRAAGLPVAVVTNQSAIGRGLASREQVDAVHARVESLVGPVATWLVCPHVPEAGCECRKPQGGLVAEAARRLGIEPRECVVVGDIGSDVQAATRAGARAVLVPTSETLRQEVESAPVVAADLGRAVDLILDGRV